MASGPARSRTGFLLVFALILGIAALARILEIGRRSIWFDEGVTLGMLRLPLGQFLAGAWRSEALNNQFLYYLALRPWHVLGEEEATLRAFSALFSVGAVALTVLLARRLFGWAAALVAGAVLAVHSLAIRTAQEARSYGLTLFLVCLAAYFLVRSLERGRRRDVLGWVLASSLAVYAHFFAIFTVAAQGIALLALGRAGTRERKQVLGGLPGIVLLTLPVLLFVLFRASPGLLHWVPPIDATRLVGFAALLAGGRIPVLLLFAAFLAVLLDRAITGDSPIQRFADALAILWALFPLGAMAIVSAWHPVLVERYVSMSVPGWALAAGAVIGPALERRSLALLGAATLGLLLVAELERTRLVYRDAYEDWRAPAAQVAAATLPGDAILYESPWSGLALGYYLDRFPRRPDPLQPGPLVFSGSFDPAEATRRERVWVVLSRERPDFEPRIDRLLGETHPAVTRRDFGAVRVVLHEAPPRSEGAPGP